MSLGSANIKLCVKSIYTIYDVRGDLIMSR